MTDSLRDSWSRQFAGGSGVFKRLNFRKKEVLNSNYYNTHKKK